MTLASAKPNTVHTGIVDRWRASLSGRAPKVAIADGDDPRAIRAAVRLYRDGAVRPLLFGDPARIRAAAVAGGIALPREVVRATRDAAADPATRAAVEDAFRGRAEELVRAADDPVFVAAAALRAGRVDACVAGARRPTRDVLRAGLRVVGLAPGVGTLSSAFLMLLPDGRQLTFADCAVVPEPSATQLADIAVAAADTHRALATLPPAIAMLSFSTQRSAEHPRVATVREATDLVRRRVPDLPVDGELQLDAAIVDSIGAAKAPGSGVAGHATVLVFPNLDAGNIGYKIAERLGDAVALGPILQGLRAPLNDLSRGCSAEDIETISLLSAVQSVH